MSFKAKDLAYDANEPTFLRKLRAGIASGDTDRHERPIARPERLKRNDEEEDGPTYVLEESGESMSKADYEALQRAQEQGNGDGVGDVNAAKPAEGDQALSDAKAKNHSIEIGKVQRKRKAGKVVGDVGTDRAGDDKDSTEVTKKAIKKPAKRAKALKLSFDED